jgi:hypothetical protein
VYSQLNDNANACAAWQESITRHEKQSKTSVASFCR